MTTHSEAFPEFQVSSPETTTRPKCSSPGLSVTAVLSPALSFLFSRHGCCIKKCPNNKYCFFKPTWPLGLSQHATAWNLISFSTCQQGATALVESKKDLWFYKCPWKKDFNNKRVLRQLHPSVVWMTKLATFVESRVGIGLTNLLLVHASVLSLLFLVFPQPITADVNTSLSLVLLEVPSC